MSLRLDNIVAVGILVALCFSALAHGAVEAWSLALLQLFIGGLALLWGLKIVFDKQLQFIFPSLAWPLISLVVLGVLQAVIFSGRNSWSEDVEATRFAVLILFGLTVFFLLQVNFIANRERVRGVAKFLSIYGFALAVFSLIQHFTWNGKFYWVRTPLSDLASPFGPFANHNHFAGYMELLIGLPLGLVISGGVRREERVFYGFVTTMMCIALIISLSRGGIVSLAVEIIFLALLSSRVLRRKQGDKGGAKMLRSLSGLLIVFATLAAGIWWIGADPVVNRLTGENQDTLATSRVWVWKDSLQVFKTYPLGGAGLGAFQTVYPHQSQYDGSQGYVAQSHNDYLQILADGGMIGGVLAFWFLWLILRAVRQGLRSTDPLITGLALGSGAGIVALLTHSMLDFNLQVPSNAMLFLLLCALASFCSRKATEQEVQIEPPPHLPQSAPRLSTGVIR